MGPSDRRRPGVPADATKIHLEDLIEHPLDIAIIRSHKTCTCHEPHPFPIWELVRVDVLECICVFSVEELSLLNQARVPEDHPSSNLHETSTDKCRTRHPVGGVAAQVTSNPAPNSMRKLTTTSGTGFGLSSSTTRATDLPTDAAPHPIPIVVLEDQV